MNDSEIIIKINQLSADELAETGLVDAYARGRLEGDSLQAFEMRLLGDTGLQDEVQLSLVLSRGLSQAGRRSLEKELAPETRGWRRLFSSAGWPGLAAPAMAAVFGVAAISLVLLYGPGQPGGDSAHLTPDASVWEQATRLARTRSGDDLAAQVDPATNEGWIALTTDLVPEGDIRHYDVSILSLPQQQQVLTIHDTPLVNLHDMGWGELRFAMHQSEVPPGEYLARISYRQAGEQHAIEEFRFAVVSSQVRD